MSAALKRWCIASVVAALSICAPAAARDVIDVAGVRGAGSTFAYPLIAKWSREYRAIQARGGEYAVANGGLDDPLPTTALDYAPTGSLAGTLSLKRREVDFAVTDVPLSAVELEKAKLVQFPIVVGGIVIGVKLPNTKSGQLRFDGATLAKIFSGRISRWSDSEIKKLNPTLTLPDADIVVVHRSDGSGTTANFTRYLAQTDQHWRETIGSNFIVKWPVGRAAKGNGGVAQAIAATQYSIGYVDFSRANAAGLTLAALQSGTDAYVPPSIATFEKAISRAAWSSVDGFQMQTIAASADAYPLIATAFVLVPNAPANLRTQNVIDLFGWALQKGQSHARALGYVPLPAPAVRNIKTHWAVTVKR